ncbi:MAG: PspC domain-containing protein [Chloroflexota bacterium]|nr:PspC domain-containing protein [Chloroflexota bacterium]
MTDQPVKRLYRSRSNRMISGVAGGMAEYLGIDPTLMRVLMFLTMLMSTGPFGIVVYLALVLIIPEAPVNNPEGASL